MSNIKRDRKNDKKNKLSWIYRKKIRQQKSKTPVQATEKDGEDEDKKARIVVRNLSFKVTKEDIKKLYESFGEVQEINLLKRPDGSLVGCGFVQFKRVEDASKAIFNTNKKEFLGRTITSDWAIPKSKFYKKATELLSGKEEFENKTESTLDVLKDKETNDEIKTDKTRVWKKEHRKLQKLNKRKKKSRIVVRNLSFQATEEKVKEHFSQYGNIEEVQILTKPDGKYIGCAFIQFEHVQSAAKAIHYANLKPLLDRAVVVDWAIPKNKFSSFHNENKDNNNGDSGEIEIKTEPMEEEDAQNVSVKEENDEINVNNSVDKLNRKNFESEEIEVKSESDEDIMENDKSLISKNNSIEAEDDDEERSGNDNDDDDNDEEDDEEDDKEMNETMTQRPKCISNDVSEGRTIFLKNLPFSVRNEELKKYMEQYGPVYYALVCIDPLTEHSKGTAFVKFKNVEDAERCLSMGTELRLHDQILEAHKALHKNEIENGRSVTQQKHKDTRNLYLVKEGVILAGSPAAAGVSASDMAKRLQLEQWKSQMLRNLNMFVSRIRLVIQNLPQSLDDTKLRQLLKNHCGPKAVITEARVMRDLKNIDAKGVGKSKEYAFVSFTNHEDALKALRSINNNPNIFSPHKRPIVAFSIENRIMVNAKQKRIQKSRERNPLWTTSKLQTKPEATEEQIPKKCARVEKSDKSDTNVFTGIMSKPGEEKLRSKFKLKNQALLHSKNVKKQKKLNKSIKMAVERKQAVKAKGENRTKQRTKFNADDAHFNKLVNNYKDKLKDVVRTKSKWYES